MTIAKVAVERFSLTSSRPFDTVVAALKSAVGQPDMNGEVILSVSPVTHAMTPRWD